VLSVSIGTTIRISSATRHVNALSRIAAFAALVDDLAHPGAARASRLAAILVGPHDLARFSEFSRTPMFNTYGGRDHHLTSSCLLAAQDRGQPDRRASGEWAWAPGATTSRRAGVTSQGGGDIKPEHIAATLPPTRARSRGA